MRGRRLQGEHELEMNASGLPRLATWRALADADRRPLAHVPGEFKGVPVREPYAAVGTALAHGVGVGRTMDAVAFG